jgi:hypothetical protein
MWGRHVLESYAISGEYFTVRTTLLLVSLVVALLCGGLARADESVHVWGASEVLVTNCQGIKWEWSRRNSKWHVVRSGSFTVSHELLPDETASLFQELEGLPRLPGFRSAGMAICHDFPTMRWHVYEEEDKLDKPDPPKRKKKAQYISRPAPK